jgi:hypothetical protein
LECFAKSLANVPWQICAVANTRGKWWQFCYASWQMVAILLRFVANEFCDLPRSVANSSNFATLRGKWVSQRSGIVWQIFAAANTRHGGK